MATCATSSIPCDGGPARTADVQWIRGFNVSGGVYPSQISAVDSKKYRREDDDAGTAERRESVEIGSVALLQPNRRPS